MRVPTILSIIVNFGTLFAAVSSAAAAAFTFTTIDVPGAPGTIASDINEAGQIVGDFGGVQPGTGVPREGFLFTNGSFTTIDVPGASSTDARGINNIPQIVGIFDDTTGEHGFLFTGGSFTTLNTFASDINDSGQIVGGDFLRQPDGSLIPIQVPGANFTDSEGINNAGQIVGFFNTNTNHGFFRDTDGSLTTFDAPGAVVTDPFGINDVGQIVGIFNDTTGEHGFLLTGGSFTTIDVPGASSTDATGINNAGQIVGSFFDAMGMRHGFLATPVSEIPEPWSLALLGVGVIAMAIVRLPIERRRTRIAGKSVSSFA